MTSNPPAEPPADLAEGTTSAGSGLSPEEREQQELEQGLGQIAVKNADGDEEMAPEPAA